MTRQVSPTGQANTAPRRHLPGPTVPTGLARSCSASGLASSLPRATPCRQVESPSALTRQVRLMPARASHSPVRHRPCPTRQSLARSRSPSGTQAGHAAPARRPMLRSGRARPRAQARVLPPLTDKSDPDSSSPVSRRVSCQVPFRARPRRRVYPSPAILESCACPAVSPPTLQSNPAPVRTAPNHFTPTGRPSPRITSRHAQIVPDQPY
jgi:hypothetical protein